MDYESITDICIDGDIIACRAAGGCKKGEPVENALHNAKNMLGNLLFLFPNAEHTIYISGWKDETNFRKLCYTQYKATRGSKPEHTEATRDYIIKQHYGQVVLGIEADDALGIHQCNSDGISCIVSIDKDLNMIPGWHYNLAKKDLYYVNDVEAFRYFYKQMLEGDRCDNIPRIKKLWKKKDVFLLLDKADTEQEMLDIVKDEIQKLYPEMGSLDINNLIDWRGTLLWILRYKTDSWSSRMAYLDYLQMS